MTGAPLVRRSAVARGLAAGCLIGGLTSTALAHEEVSPPGPREQPSAPWPAGHELGTDLIVPVVISVGVTGDVEGVELEAGVGEPYDSAALATALRFKFEPARAGTEPRRARVRAIVRFRAAPPPAVPAPPPPPPPAPVAPPRASPVEVTVTGRTPPRSASETVLERPVLELAPHKNASELLLEVPGVFVSQHSGEGKAHQIFFRGFDAVHGQDVEIWAAGAPVNEVSNIHGQGYADLHFLIPEVVEQIRSTPGTYDLRQGDFAVAGTLRFGLGYDEPGVTAQASLGNFGTRRYFMAYRPLNAPSSTFAAFELYATDGFGPSRAARHGSAIVQATHDFGQRVEGRLMASTYAGRFDSAGVLRLRDVETNAVDRFATYDRKQGGYSSRTQLVLELGSAARDDSRWSVSPFLVLRSLELRSNFTGFLTSPEGDSNQQVNEATTLGANAAYRRSLDVFSDRDALEAGVYLRADAIRQSQHRLSILNDRVTDDAERPGIDAEIRAGNAAAYLDAELHPLRRVALRGGVRADALSYRTEDTGGSSAGQVRSAAGAQLSKRGTLDVALWPGLRAVASYGEGFRSPQARSLGDGETTPFTRVTSVEAGLRFRDERRFQASAALYRTELSDDLVFDHATGRNELVPGTSRTGFAANLIAEPRPWLGSSTSFTYTRAVFDDSGAGYEAGDPLPYVPEFVVRSDLAVKPVLGRFFGHDLRGQLGTGLTYLGRRPLPYSELGHDVFLVDVGLSLRLGPVETRLEVFNLLDAEWYDGEFVYASDFGGAASLVPTRHVSVGPPRTLLWSLSTLI